MPRKRTNQGLCMRGKVDNQPLAFVLSRGENSVGASKDNSIVIKTTGVSRQHALIRWDDEGIQVQDLGSKNGTWLNGERIETATAAIGDEIAFGPALLRFESIDGADAAIAIAVETVHSRKSLSPSQWSRSRTPTEHNGLVPTAWLPLISELARVPSTSVVEKLETLRVTLGTQGTAVIEWRRNGEAIVRDLAGSLENPEIITALATKLAGTAVSHGHSKNITIFELAGEPPAVAAIDCNARDLSRALVFIGETSHQNQIGSLLRACFEFLWPIETQKENQHLPRKPFPDLTFPPEYVIGRSPAMTSVYHQLRSVLCGDIPVLITGETGVGKEHIARLIHSCSPQSRGRFVAVNCAAIPSNLLEAELFGIEEGVATGVSKREGKLVQARGGVILFDEIGDMPPELQAKLLRSLQEKEVHPIGARHPIPLDVRVVCITNADLQERIASGRFRSDLFYRISGCTLRIPPLRERRGDIPELVKHFMDRYANQVGKSVRGISNKALEALVHAPWPGNVRELEHEVRRMVFTCPEGQHITSEMLSPGIVASNSEMNSESTIQESDLNRDRHIEALDRKLITTALARSRGQRAGAARLLGMSRQGLLKTMRRLGLEE